MHVLVFELLDSVAAHDFITDLVLVLANHETSVLMVAVALVGDLLIAVQLLFHCFLQGLLLVIAELGEGPN